MGLIHLVVLLLVLGFIMWAVNYLFAKYIKEEFLDLANKLAFVAAIILVLLWVLSLLGLFAFNADKVFFGR